MISPTDKTIPWARRMFILSLVLVLIAAVVPYGSKAETITVSSIGLDKIVHFVGFGIMTVFAFFAGRGLLYWKRLLLVLLVPLLGVVVEVVQYYLPYRTFNPVDIFANLCGVLCGIVVWGLLFSRRAAKTQRKRDLFSFFS